MDRTPSERQGDGSAGPAYLSDLTPRVPHPCPSALEGQSCPERSRSGGDFIPNDDRTDPGPRKELRNARPPASPSPLLNLNVPILTNS